MSVSPFPVVKMFLQLTVVCLAAATGVFGMPMSMNPGKGLNKAVAFFNMEGFHGPVALFRNGSKFHVDLRWLTFTDSGDLSVDIHNLPFRIGQRGSPCSSIGGDFNPENTTPPLGDLSGHPGGRKVNSTAKWFAVTGTNLTIVGLTGIIGRSLAFHNSSGTIVACANIVHANEIRNMQTCGSMSSTNSENTMEVVYNGRISGRITFRSLMTKAVGEGTSDSTSIFSHLFYTDGSTSSTGHPWHIHNGSCSRLGPVLVNLTPPTANIGATSAGTSGRLVSSMNLMYTLGSYWNKPVAIHAANGTVVACAHLNMVHRRTFSATFSEGTVKVSQKSAYSSSEVSLGLNTASAPSKISINKFRSTPSSSGCSAAKTGGTFDPFGKMGKTPMSPGTPDKYPAGDVGAKFPGKKSGSECDASISLFGVNSVARRSISITVGGQEKCATMTEELQSGDKMMRAKAVFGSSGPVQGMMTIEQVARSDGTMGITTISSDGLMNMDGASLKHNYHVHIGRKGYQNDTSACGAMFAMGHYNPFGVHTDRMYATDCNSDNQLRCELGDTSKKSGTLDLNMTKVLRQDTFMPLMGQHTVMGRSLVIHTANKTGPRLACANIIPMSAYDVQIGVKTSRLRGGKVNATIFANMVKASSSTARDSQVLYATAYDDTVSGCTYINAAIDGTNAQDVASKLSRADLGTEYSQMASECTQGVSFAVYSSASALSQAFSMVLLVCVAALLL